MLKHFGHDAGSGASGKPHEPKADLAIARAEMTR
jgi:hypothetical protein